MEQSHVAMYRRLLESIALYSQKMLDRLEHGAGDFPQWTNDLVSESRTHIADVTHFLRGQASEGIRYGQANHGRAYMATANLRQINQYAKECLSLMQKGSGYFPAWVENKISVVAEYMDLIGHWLENEGVEGRQYGASQGSDSSDAWYRGQADSISGVHRNPYSPNDHRRKAYEDGFQSGYGARHYGAKGGAGGGRGGGRGAGGGRGPGRSGGPRGGGRRGGPRGPARGDGMGRGRGRRRRHRRHGVHIFPYWNVPHYWAEYPVYIEPLPIPTVTGVTARIRNGRAVIGLQGHGFNSIPGDSVEVLYSIQGITLGTAQATSPMIRRSDNEIEFILPVARVHLGQLQITDIGYYDYDGNTTPLGPQIFSFMPYPLDPFPRSSRSYSQSRPSSTPERPSIPASTTRPLPPPTNTRPLPPATLDPSTPIPADIHPAGKPGKPGVVYQPGYGSMMALGPAPTTPENMAPSQMEQTMPPSRMLEAHRQGLQHRQLWQQTGRRFGVPGFVAGQPGWAGAGGVAQIPHPRSGMRRAPDRTFGAGFSAGQGGVQTWPGGGPMAVQTYGSLGYASMGDGSMDMAARGSIRRYSGGGSVSLKKTKVGPRAARRSRKRR